MENTTRSHPIWRYWVFSLGFFLGELLAGAVSAYLLYYYTVIQGLSTGYYTIAMVIYAVYNAINDPAIGYITDKTYKINQKWGKRFPWIMIGMILFLIVIQLVYWVPFSSTFGMVVWLLLVLCLGDTLYSLFFVNYYALMPVLFKSGQDRRTLANASTYLGTLGSVLGFMAPPLLADQNNPSSFNTMILIVGIIGLVSIILMIPSIKESKALTAELIKHDKSKEEEESFFSTLKNALKEKNFLVYIIVFLLFQSFTSIAVSTIPFYVEHVLGDSTGDSALFLILAEFGATFLFIPLWVWLSKKIGFNKVFLIGTIWLAVSIIPLFFITDIMMATVTFFFFGIGLASFWAMLNPLFSQSVDEVTVNQGKHIEGTYAGIRTFVSRFAIVVQSVLILIIQTATQFNPSDATQTITDQIKFGIKFQMVGVGVILMSIAAVIFWKFYDLDEKKHDEIKLKLLEM